MVGEGGGGTVDVCVSVCDGIKVDKHVRIHKTAAADGGSAGGDYRHTRKKTPTSTNDIGGGCCGAGRWQTYTHTHPQRAAQCPV